MQSKFMKSELPFFTQNMKVKYYVHYSVEPRGKTV